MISVLGVVVPKYAPARVLKLLSVEGPAHPPLAKLAAVPGRGRQVGPSAGGAASVKVARLGKESSVIALTVHATGLPVDGQGYESPLGYESPMRSTECAPEGFSWPWAVAVPALGSSCQESMEEQAGSMPAESRRWEVAPTILEGSRNSREGSPSDAEGPQFREGFPPGVGSVAAEMKWVSQEFTVGVNAEVVSSAPVLHKDCASAFPRLRGDRKCRLRS